MSDRESNCKALRNITKTKRKLVAWSLNPDITYSMSSNVTIRAESGTTNAGYLRQALTNKVQGITYLALRFVIGVWLSKCLVRRGTRLGTCHSTKLINQQPALLIRTEGQCLAADTAPDKSSKRI